MICERCQKKNAAVIHRSIRGGRMQVRYVCATCSEVLEATGELEDISAALPPYTASMIREDGGCFPFFLPAQDKNRVEAGGEICPLCGMSEAELLAEGRAGCPQCYATFGRVIAHATAAMHRGAMHVGRVPAAVRRRQEKERRLSELREKLQGAIAGEAYEEAAALRDEIRGLEAKACASCIK